MRIIRVFIIIISSVVAAVALLLLFFVITEYRPSEITDLAPVYDSSAPVSSPGGIRILSWNTGYCGLDAESDMFTEGGASSVRTSIDRQRKSLDSVISFLEKQEADINFLQEVDTKSRRTWKTDQLYTLSSRLNGYESYYAVNFKSPFVPYPLKSPIGKVDSGIMTMSRFAVQKAERLQLPGSYIWPVKIFHLKRCALVSRLKSPEEGKDWYLINIHLSAYDDGTMRMQQLEYLKQLMLSLYNEGHYVVIGGDWNAMFPGVTKESFGKYSTSEENISYIRSIPDEWTPENWQWCYDREISTSRSLDQPYVPGENFTTIIDGFLVSPNLRVDEIHGFDLRFADSDHNPVALTVSIR